MSVTPALRYLKPSSGFCAHRHTPSPVHTHAYTFMDTYRQINWLKKKMLAIWADKMAWQIKTLAVKSVELFFGPQGAPRHMGIHTSHVHK